MQEQSGGYTGNYLLAFMAGAAIGGLVVALTTPKSGDELRADLKGMGTRLKDKAGDAMESAGTTYQDARERVGQAASDAKAGLKDLASEMRQDLRG